MKINGPGFWESFQIIAPFKQPIIPAWPYSLCWEELSGELSILENVDTKSGNYPSECRLNLISFFCKNSQGKSNSFLHSEENFKGTETSRENWAIIYPWSWSLWQQSLIAWRREEILNIRLCQTVHSSFRKALLYSRVDSTLITSGYLVG